MSISCQYRRDNQFLVIKKVKLFFQGLLAAICGVLEAWVLYDIHYDPTSKGMLLESRNNNPVFSVHEQY